MHKLLATFLLAGLLSVSGCERGAVDASDADATAPFENAHFTVSVSGQGPDVVLVPGLASNAEIWDQTVAAFGDQFTFHRIQVSGFAGAASRGNAGNDDILDDLADGLSAYSRSLDQPPALVGHSLGGLVVLKTALDADAALDRIVVIDVLPFFSVLMDEAATVDTMTPVSAFMKATLLAQPDDEFAQRQAEALATLVKDEGDVAQSLQWSIASDRAVMAQAMSEVLVTDLRADVSRIAVPTTVLYAKDPAIPNMAAVEAFYHDLYAPLPDGHVVAIDNALHFIMLDQPEAFRTALLTALED